MTPCLCQLWTTASGDNPETTSLSVASLHYMVRGGQDGDRFAESTPQGGSERTGERDRAPHRESPTALDNVEGVVDG